jgi:gamma-glutamylcyclotransferase (GGCT)/AIG2-like uncharacterized protein YtfP
MRWAADDFHHEQSGLYAQDGPNVAGELVLSNLRVDCPWEPREDRVECGHEALVARGSRMTGRDRAANTRLAIYGTLAPGRANHHQLEGLKGQWQQGTVRGRLADAGWAAALGYPGLVLDPMEPVIEVHLFESAELPDHWPRLDAFEGTGYRRVVTQVRTADGELDAWIYVIAA